MAHAIDEEGRLIAVSAGWLAKLGFARCDVVGRPASDFLAPESRERAGAVDLPEFFRRERCENVAYRMLSKTGARIDVLLSTMLVSGAPDLGRVCLATLTDVTDLRAAERRLAESEERYRGIVEDQTELVSLSSPNGELRFVNHAYARHYGLEPAEMIGRNLFDFVPPEHRAEVADHFSRVCACDRSVTDENRVLLPNGQTRWMSWTNRALRDEQGRVTGVHSVGRDIDQRVRTEQRLKHSEAQYRMLAEHSTDMVLALDLNLKRVYVSPACREMFGYEPEEMIGGASGLMAHPDDAEQVAEVLQALLSGRVERETAVARRRHRDGRWIWVEARYRALKDPDSGATTGIVASVRDISARKTVEDRLAEAYRRLEAAAREDGLTGLANRRTFDDALAAEYGRARRDDRNLSLLMIDVDGFKPFNDLYGHPAGDECLRRIGKTLTGALFRPGDLAARYGGEEFAVLLPDTDEFGAAVIGERIRCAVLALAIAHEGCARRVMTISAGVASMGRRGLEDGPEVLVRSADRALYRAKHAGRNVVVCAAGALACDAISPNAA
jgi:diguanylate cyclase (GGDEF)-like protein/PAS domain S-box-containing protein